MKKFKQSEKPKPIVPKEISIFDISNETAITDNVRYAIGELSTSLRSATYKIKLEKARSFIKSSGSKIKLPTMFHELRKFLIECETYYLQFETPSKEIVDYTVILTQWRKFKELDSDKSYGKNLLPLLSAFQEDVVNKYLSKSHLTLSGEQLYTIGEYVYTRRAEQHMRYGNILNSIRDFIKEYDDTIYIPEQIYDFRNMIFECELYYIMYEIPTRNNMEQLILFEQYDEYKQSDNEDLILAKNLMATNEEVCNARMTREPPIDFPEITLKNGEKWQFMA